MLYTANRREQCILDPLSPGVYNQFALFNFAVQGMHWRRKRGGGGGGGGGGRGGDGCVCDRGTCTPHFYYWGAMVCLCPLTFNPTF